MNETMDIKTNPSSEEVNEKFLKKLSPEAQEAQEKVAIGEEIIFLNKLLEKEAELSIDTELRKTTKDQTIIKYCKIVFETMKELSKKPEYPKLKISTVKDSILSTANRLELNKINKPEIKMTDKYIKDFIIFDICTKFRGIDLTVEGPANKTFEEKLRLAA